MEKTKKFEVTSMILHILAMIFMLCDHLWGMIIPGNDWLTCIDRLALPIFAMGSRISYIVHQNILWSFLIGIGLIHLNEKAKKTGNKIIRILTAVGTVTILNTSIYKYGDDWRVRI